MSSRLDTLTVGHERRICLIWLTNYPVYQGGFEKNERSNISDNELEALKQLADDLLALSKIQINEAVRNGSLVEVPYET